MVKYVEKLSKEIEGEHLLAVAVAIVAHGVCHSFFSSHVEGVTVRTKVETAKSQLFPKPFRKLVVSLAVAHPASAS